jgi:aminoglycoside phosphotransferase (APT) family kinase protein
VSVSNYEEITGGYSRYMARFSASHGSETDDFILRADPPPGKSIIDTDRTAEWKLVQAISADGGVTAPQGLWFDETGDEIGSPAIIFEKIEGETLFQRTQLGDVESHLHLTDQIADVAASVHGVDTTGLPDHMDRPSSWSSYIDDNITRWLEGEKAHAESDPFMRVVASWLDANRPPEAPLTLVHGDLQAPNMMIEEGSGDFYLLDWELSRIGDPREDLGWWALAGKSQPPDLIEAGPDAFYARYREKTGFSKELVNPATVAYFTVLGSFAVFNAVIEQTAAMARGQSSGTSVAYMTNAVPFMHSVFIDSMRRAGAWGEEAQ